MTDREKLVELIGEMQLHGYVEKHDADGVWCWRPSNELLADHLLANGFRLETKQATSDKAREWISVKDRLPKSGVNVLTLRRRHEDGAYSQRVDSTVPVYDGTFVWFSDMHSWKSRVTHWMPLPEAPKED